MGVCGHFVVYWKCLVVLSLRLLFLVPAGLPVRSQGDSQSDNKVMDNITVRQGETVFLSVQQPFSIDLPLTGVEDCIHQMLQHGFSSQLVVYAGKRSDAHSLAESIKYIVCGEDKWSVDPRVSLVILNEEEFTIKIENVDTPDEGQYICAVQTRSRPRTTSVHVIVQVPPKIKNLSKDLTVNEGSNVTLMCIASGKPEPTVTWKLLSSAGLVAEDEYLEIPSISRQRAGTYECSAVNEVAADAQTVELTVNCKPPSVTEGRDVGVTLGQRGVLQCEADAVPAADFEWYRDDRRLFSDLDGIEIDDDGKVSMLTFFNVSEVDYGNYTCVVMNKLGSVNTSMVLYGPGAVQDGNSGTMGTQASTCLLIIIGLQLLLKF